METAQQADRGPITLDDGRFVFGITRPDGERTEHALDILTFRLTCEKLEAKHSLARTAEGGIQPTPEFLRDLSAELSRDIADCTPTVAWQLWVASFAAMERLKKNMSGTPS